MCKRHNLDIPSHWSFVDTLPYFRQTLPELKNDPLVLSPYSLSNIYYHYTTRRLEGAHNARFDVHALRFLVKETNMPFSKAVTEPHWPRDEDSLLKVRYIGKVRCKRIIDYLRRDHFMDPNAKLVKGLRNYATAYPGARLEQFLRQEVRVTSDAHCIEIISQVLKRSTLDISLDYLQWKRVVLEDSEKAALRTAGITTADMLRDLYSSECKRDPARMKQWLQTCGVREGVAVTLCRAYKREFGT
jgi:hypothetical protein